MRSRITFVAAALVVGWALAALTSRQAPAQGAKDVAPKSKLAKTSYALGYTVGKSIRDQDVQMDVDVFVQAVRDGLKGDRPEMTDDDMATTIKEFRREVLMRQKERAERLAAENQKKGKAFRDAHARESGVSVTASGLQYRVLREGSGKRPMANGLVEVHYVGKLIDGTEFANTVRRGKAAILALGVGALPGWSEGIQLMKEGAKYEFVLPSELAYGTRGTAAVPPGATVIFEIELLKVR